MFSVAAKRTHWQPDHWRPPPSSSPCLPRFNEAQSNYVLWGVVCYLASVSILIFNEAQLNSQISFFGVVRYLASVCWAWPWLCALNMTKWMGIPEKRRTIHSKVVSHILDYYKLFYFQRQASCMFLNYFSYLTYHPNQGIFLLNFCFTKRVYFPPIFMLFNILKPTVFQLKFSVFRRLESLLEASCTQFYACLMHLSCMP